MEHPRIRLATIDDQDAVISLRFALWPDGSQDEHRSDVRGILTGRPRSTLPLVIFVAEVADRLVGFAEVGLRSHADGCDPSQPCGYLEGWYVVPTASRRGVGRALVERAEDWARLQGCVELASDTWIDNEPSQRAHVALGFEVVDRCVNYRKRIAEAVHEGGTGKKTATPRGGPGQSPV
jgi:aminoglycoside 6'-N-acetyltransferase I